ncbi:DUF6444 domain-containing protein [Roseiconus lacunae]|uniref:DUF6444 domain-containing protein n=1 Tax=Roseiconus lacunae TaxID=2605694 RepID=UPI003F52F9F0
MSTGDGCPDCERWEQRFKELERKFDAVVKQLDETTRKLDEATAKLAAATKDSTNSSKPPSSDIVKPNRPRKPAGKRKKGGQKGHRRTIRPAVLEDELDWLTQYAYDNARAVVGQ